jgi:hypothetical protein
LVQVVVVVAARRGPGDADGACRDRESWAGDRVVTHDAKSPTSTATARADFGNCLPTASPPALRARLAVEATDDLRR